MKSSGTPNSSNSRSFVRRIRAVDYEALGAGNDFEDKLLKRSGTTPGYILLFDENYDPIGPVNSFLQAHCRVSRAVSTQNAYANDLAAWWTYLKTNEIAWDKVDLTDIDGYTAGLVQKASRKTGMILSNSTLIRRVCAIESFYLWAYSEGLLGQRPVIGMQVPSDANSKMYASAGSDRRVYMRRDHGRPKIPKQPEPDAHVKPLTAREMESIRCALGPNPYEDREPGSRSIRNRLMADLAIATGMRIDEVCHLETLQLDEFAQEAAIAGPEDMISLRLTHTKGGDKRTVEIVLPLWEALVAYKKGERDQAIKKAKANAAAAGGRPFREHFMLFVNGSKANPRDVGRPVSADTISRAFRKAVVECGQTRKVKIFRLDPTGSAIARDPVTGAALVDKKLVARHTFHDLRHTFAVTLYRTEIQAKRPAPLKKLQALLGHRQMATTEDIYLKYCEANMPKIEDELAAALRRRSDDAE